MSETSKSWYKKAYNRILGRHAPKLLKPLSMKMSQMSKLEADIAHNLTSLRSITVEDIMIPRADIIAMSVKTSLGDLIDQFKSSHHSRLLIFAGTLDDIIGFVHIKDVLVYAQKPKEANLKALLRKVLFVSPSLGAMDLLYRMQTTGMHLAIVVDEYGGTDGLITIDDILEKIVGDIEDEFVTQEEVPSLALQSDGSYLADARVLIHDLETSLGLKFSEQEHAESDTLGGLIFALIGRIPIRGEVIQHHLGLEFHILEVDPRRIHKMMIVKK